MNKSGFTLIEVLVSTVILTIIMLSLAEFSGNILSVADRHTQQLSKAIDSRSVMDLMINNINKAVYIFPKGMDIGLYVGDSTAEGSEININTDGAVVMLVPDIDNSSNVKVFAYYLVPSGNGLSNLFEFVGEGESVKNWPDNTIPEDSIGTAFVGSTTKIAEYVNKENSGLTYLLNYENGITDPALRGEVGNATVTDNNALIEGIEWNLDINRFGKTTEISVKGVSKNVPR